MCYTYLKKSSSKLLYGMFSTYVDRARNIIESLVQSTVKSPKTTVLCQVKQHEFREDFRKTAPFMFGSQNVYEKLDKVRIKDFIKDPLRSGNVYPCWIVQGL